MRSNRPPALPFVDLGKQRARLNGRIEAAIARVLRHGRFIMGPEVGQLETALATYARVDHALTCANGTDALLLILEAVGIGPGDAVFVPAFTFAASAEAVALVGATPVLVDVDPITFNLDPDRLVPAIGMIAAAGALRPAAVIAVDLFGQPADYHRLTAIARAHGLVLVQDAAQSFGARCDGAPVGAQGDAAATSFYPSKPLGAYGDGGAVLTSDPAIAAAVRTLRVHGTDPDHAERYQRIGHNSRLDTLQAAILLEKLAALDDELAARAAIAGRYQTALAGMVEVPRIRPGARSSWAQYTIRVDRRDRLVEQLRELGIPTAIYYPKPLHRQPAYGGYPIAPDGLEVAESLAATVVSLPIHADLDRDQQARVVDGVVKCTIGLDPRERSA